MPKKIVVFVMGLICWQQVQSQSLVGKTELARDLYNKAKAFVAQRDYPNSILVYNQLAKLEPNNLVYRRELAYTYYLNRDFNRAIQVVAPLIKSKRADETTFLVASKIYDGRGFVNQAYEAIERGLRRYPNSGELYAEYGSLYLKAKKISKAQQAWETGIKKDPNYHLNYYHLAKRYFRAKKPLWAIIYSETFINKERFSSRTDEMKRLLFDAYKQLIANNQMTRLKNVARAHRKSRKHGAFENRVNSIYTNLSSLVLGGVDIDNIVMLRTRILLEWAHTQSKDYPYALFSHLNTILADGHFEAYNQWLFGKAANEKRFLEWVQDNKAAYTDFETYFAELNYTIVAGQYYK